MLREMLGSDLNRLTAIFVDICERHRDNRDFTRHDIHQALRDVVCCFPVYRTYVRAEQGQSLKRMNAISTRRSHLRNRPA